jgi:hypothetical protein
VGTLLFKVATLVSIFYSGKGNWGFKPVGKTISTEAPRKVGDARRITRGGGVKTHRSFEHRFQILHLSKFIFRSFLQ